MSKAGYRELMGPLKKGVTYSSISKKSRCELPTREVKKARSLKKKGGKGGKVKKGK